MKCIIRFHSLIRIHVCWHSARNASRKTLQRKPIPFHSRRYDMFLLLHTAEPRIWWLWAWPPTGTRRRSFFYLWALLVHFIVRRWTEKGFEGKWSEDTSKNTLEETNGNHRKRESASQHVSDFSALRSQEVRNRFKFSLNGWVQSINNHRTQDRVKCVTHFWSRWMWCCVRLFRPRSSAHSGSNLCGAAIVRRFASCPLTSPSCILRLPISWGFHPYPSLVNLFFAYLLTILR